MQTTISELLVEPGGVEKNALTIASSDFLREVSYGPFPKVPNEVMPGEIRNYNVTLAELTNDSEHIEVGAQLIINIPKDFEFLGVVSNTGFTVPPPTIFPDGSTQIVGTLTGILDDGSRYIEFSAKAPSEGTTKMYVMHILGTGSTDKSGPKLAIGPVAETVIQVCGVLDGCP